MPSPDADHQRADAVAEPRAESPDGRNTEATRVAGASLADLRAPSRGYRDEFLELRHRDVGQLDLQRLSDSKVIAPLSKTRHRDELYEVPEGHAIEPGIYRIRDEGAPKPFVTVKRHGDGRTIYSETIDIMAPTDELLGDIRKHGTLLAVIKKERVTHKSKNEPNCLIHHDRVEHLGEFFDVKADTAESMERFVKALGLNPQTEVNKTYYEMRKERGISNFQLAVWKFHERFEDYVIGVVGGTLTPLNFLAGFSAAGASDGAILVAIALAAFGDGAADAVATSQAEQSQAGATTKNQAAKIAKTLVGKAVVPLTFVPIVIGASSEIATIGLSLAWSAVVLSATAAIQKIASEEAILPAVGRLLAFSAGGVGVGVTAGKLVPWIAQMFGIAT